MEIFVFWGGIEWYRVLDGIKWYYLLLSTYYLLFNYLLIDQKLIDNGSWLIALGQESARLPRVRGWVIGSRSCSRCKLLQQFASPQKAVCNVSLRNRWYFKQHNFCVPEAWAEGGCVESQVWGVECKVWGVG